MIKRIASPCTDAFVVLASLRLFFKSSGTRKGMYTTLFLQIVANSKENEILGIVNERLKIKIKAPAVEGRANQELIKFLSKKFSIPKGEITILAGEGSKFKKIKILSNDKLEAFLAEMG